MSDRLVNFVFAKRNTPVNGGTIYRGDREPMSITVVEPGQAGAALRFVAKLQSAYPQGNPQILKSGSDFTISVTPAGNVLTATVTIDKKDTNVFFDKTILIYDLERILNEGEPTEDISTLERGTLTIAPDIATNF